LMIKYTNHAEIKFNVLKKYGIDYSKSQIENVLQNPEKVEDSRKNRKIAQKQVNSTHLIRVVYEENGDDIIIITFYPARRKRYETTL